MPLTPPAPATASMVQRATMEHPAPVSAFAQMATTASIAAASVTAKTAQPVMTVLLARGNARVQQVITAAIAVTSAPASMAPVPMGPVAMEPVLVRGTGQARHAIPAPAPTAARVTTLRELAPV